MKPAKLVNLSILRRFVFFMSYELRWKYCAQPLLGLAALLLVATAVRADDIVPPDNPGPFNVGVTTFSATMTGGRVTTVQVFYPTFDPADDGFRYSISYGPGTYELRSALGAAADAEALPLLNST